MYRSPSPGPHVYAHTEENVPFAHIVRQPFLLVFSRFHCRRRKGQSSTYFEHLQETFYGMDGLSKQDLWLSKGVFDGIRYEHVPGNACKCGETLCVLPVSCRNRNSQRPSTEVIEVAVRLQGEQQGHQARPSHVVMWLCQLWCAVGRGAVGRCGCQGGTAERLGEVGYKPRGSSALAAKFRVALWASYKLVEATGRVCCPSLHRAREG
jgi:hypothetical protein